MKLVFVLCLATLALGSRVGFGAEDYCKYPFKVLFGIESPLNQEQIVQAGNARARFSRAMDRIKLLEEEDIRRVKNPSVVKVLKAKYETQRENAQVAEDAEIEKGLSDACKNRLQELTKASKDGISLTESLVRKVPAEEYREPKRTISRSVSPEGLASRIQTGANRLPDGIKFDVTNTGDKDIVAAEFKVSFFYTGKRIGIKQIIANDITKSVTVQVVVRFEEEFDHIEVEFVPRK